MELTSMQDAAKESGPILITGAGGGIGASLAEALLSMGLRHVVFHHRRRSEALRSVLTRYDLDPAVHLVHAELTDETHICEMHTAVRERYGPLYGLINLAGASTNRLSWKMSREEFQQVVDANLLSTFLCCREFIPEMRDHSRGRIINISSVVGYTGVAGAAHYCAAKAGIIGLTKALAAELAPKQIAVTAIALGYFQYGLIDSIPPELQEQIRSTIPARRFGTSCELAGLIAFLLSPAGSYSGGQVYHLNGGLHS